MSLLSKGNVQSVRSRSLAEHPRLTPPANRPTMTATRLLIIKLGDTLPHVRTAKGDFEDWIAYGLRASGKALDIEVCDPRQGDAAARACQQATFLSTRWRGGDRLARHGDRPRRLERAHRLLAARRCECRVARARHLLWPPIAGARRWAAPYTITPTAWKWAPPTCGSQMTAKTTHCLPQLPSHWPAQVAHRQSVGELPPGAVHLAHNRFEPHHAFRVGQAWGVQFHPEFDDTDATRAYIEHLSGSLVQQGESIHALNAAVQPTPVAASLLARFANVACGAAHRPHAA